MLSQRLSILAVLFVVFISCKTTHTQNIKEETRIFIQNLADSINNLKDGGVIPLFVVDPCLDRQSQYWPNLHNPIPIRKLIVNKVTNQEAILYIMSFQDSRLKQTCINIDTTNKLKYYRIPYIQLSFYDLFYNRLSELRNRMTY